MDGAPTSFFDVERERRSRIWLLFATLVGVFFVGVWVLTLCVGLAASATIFDTRVLWLTYTPPGLAALLLCSAGVAWLYWRLSRVGAQERLLTAMNARPIDPSDRFHQRLKNIVDEIAVAGGCPRLRCVVVPTVGMNAFAFSDFAGGGTIGVTEGALARLSREQLQGVVAHEAAHVLSGDCVTVTAACLLFGVYSSAMAGLSDLGAGSENDQAAIACVPGVGSQPGFLLLSGVFALLALAVALINSAISRQREYRADAAAVRYTRDPLGLAQALGMMARHAGGAGCIPWGLAALCIRPTGSSAYGWLDRLTETHPPIDCRIAVLLRLAAASTASFASRSSEAEEALEQREHLLRPPATVGGAMVAAALGLGADSRPLPAWPAQRVPRPRPPPPARAVRPAAPRCARPTTRAWRSSPARPAEAGWHPRRRSAGSWRGGRWGSPTSSDVWPRSPRARAITCGARRSCRAGVTHVPSRRVPCAGRA